MLDIRIMAIPKRRDNVELLQRKLGIDNDHVFYDSDRKGLIWNALRAWAYPAKEGAAVVVLQEDIEVTDNFMQAAQALNEAFEDSIFAFFMSEIPAGAAPGVYRMPTGIIRAPAIMMPGRRVKGFLEFYRRWFPDEKFNYDDSAMGMYAVLNGIPVLTTSPSLVRCRDEIKSTFSGHSKKNTQVWAGERPDIDAILNGGRYLDKFRRRNTHLPKNNALRLMIEEKEKDIEAVLKRRTNHGSSGKKAVGIDGNRTERP